MSAFSETFSLQEVYNAYFDCRRSKRWSDSAIKFEIDLTENITRLWRELNNKTYEIGVSYCFLVYRPKIREVFAADFRDRIVHHLVIKNLKPYFENYFIDRSYSCREGKGTLLAQIELFKSIYEESKGYTKDCYIGKFDCKSFFMSIDKNILWNKLKIFIENNYFRNNKEHILWLCQKIIFHCPEKNCIFKTPPTEWIKLPANKSLFLLETGLPIGNLTSQWFANFLLTDFDKWASNQFIYGRYVDDFYVITSTRNQCRNFYRNAKKYLEENDKIFLNPNKIYIQHYSKGVKFVGAVMKNYRAYISNSVIGNLTKLLYDFEVSNHSVAALNSYLGLLRPYSSYHIILKIKDILKNYPIKFKNTYAIYRT